MKRLYDGCRVRVVYCNAVPGLAGTETRIIGESERCFGLFGDEWIGYPVDLGLAGFRPTADQLEPIQDPGRELVSWESMRDLWTPAGGVVV
jgi:hypothetical protein